MYGYIVPDIVQKDVSSVKKFNEKSKIIFQMETTSTSQRFEANPISTPPDRFGPGRTISENNQSQNNEY